jgi:MSHA pilin protein MshD
MIRLERGATLVELVMTIVIISVAIAGVTGAFALIAGRSADPLNQTRAVELAQLYMDEIISKKYDESTPPGGQPKHSGPCNIGSDGSETRSTFDDVDDYDGLNDAPPASASNALNGYGGFSVQVAVSCAGDDAGIGLPSEEAKRVDLTITDPSGQAFVFAAYKANF